MLLWSAVLFQKILIQSKILQKMPAFFFGYCNRPTLLSPYEIQVAYNSQKHPSRYIVLSNEILTWIFEIPSMNYCSGNRVFYVVININLLPTASFQYFPFRCCIFFFATFYCTVYTNHGYGKTSVNELYILTPSLTLPLPLSLRLIPCSNIFIKVFIRYLNLI